MSEKVNSRILAAGCFTHAQSASCTRSSEEDVAPASPSIADAVAAKVPGLSATQHEDRCSAVLDVPCSGAGGQQLHVFSHGVPADVPAGFPSHSSRTLLHLIVPQTGCPS